MLSGLSALASFGLVLLARVTMPSYSGGFSLNSVMGLCESLGLVEGTESHVYHGRLERECAAWVSLPEVRGATLLPQV